jgi:4,5-dihydroxyphthalate decarboxylase
MSDLEVTIALDRYDRHVPLFLGAIKPPKGLRYQALEVGMVPPRRHGIDRHRRMLRDLEFDAAEVSLASYIMAKAQGVPLVGVPVFPRRLFSQNHIFVNRNAGIHTPMDLVGKRVGLWAFQVTMSVLAKGDLKFHHGVPWERIHWITQFPEEIAWSSDGVRVEAAPDGRDLGEMLISGEIDALIHPHPPSSVQDRTDRVRRLFEDTESECTKYAAKSGYYPIMHLLAVKEELVRGRPALPRELMSLWEEAKQEAYDFYHDPGYALLAYSRNGYERQIDVLGRDAWPSGLRANRQNLEQFIKYMVDQRLIAAPIEVETLFDKSLIDT